MQTFIVCFLATVTVAAAAVVSGGNIGTSASRPPIKFLTMVEGKAFFVVVTAMNWTDSGAYCNSMNLRLAEITSKVQWDAILAAYSQEEFGNYSYWTGGRDALSLQQFVWNATGLPLSSDYIAFKRTIIDTWRTCASIHFHPTQGVSMYGFPCNGIGSLMCETK